MESLLRSLLVPTPCLDTAIEDVLRTLIVPPPLPSTSVGAPYNESHCFLHPVVDTKQTSTVQVPSTSVTEPKNQSTAQPGLGSTPTKNRRKKNRSNQKPRQNPSIPEQSKPIKPTLLSQSAGIQKAKKRKQYHLYHPDRPKGSSRQRTAVSYEDLYDDPLAQRSKLSSAGLQDLAITKSNPEARHTCFFWYHGSCKRSQDRKGCQLRHGFQDPPKMIEAPPGFVHPRPCDLEWCKGDGKRQGQSKGRKAQVEAEPKRYFEVDVPDGYPAHQTAGQVAKDEVDCFLRGLEGIGTW